MRFFEKHIGEKNARLLGYILDAHDEMPNAKVRPAVLILPGGGYHRTSEREAEPIAMEFLAMGYHAFVLHYSVKEDSLFPRPLDEAEACLRLIRENAEDWGVIPDKIAAIGFSAGGHLCAALGTLATERANALLLVYPCTLPSISPILAHPIPDVAAAVDENTPPAFIASTWEDNLVPIEHSLAFANAMDAKNRPCEVHLFLKGIHGLSLANDVTGKGEPWLLNENFAKWMPLCKDFLHVVFGKFPMLR